MNYDFRFIFLFVDPPLWSPRDSKLLFEIKVCFSEFLGGRNVGVPSPDPQLTLSSVRRVTLFSAEHCKGFQLHLQRRTVFRWATPPRTRSPSVFPTASPKGSEGSLRVRYMSPRTSCSVQLRCGDGAGAGVGQGGKSSAIALWIGVLSPLAVLRKG